MINVVSQLSFTIYLEDQLAAGIPMTEIAETPGYSRLYFETLDRDGRDATGARQSFPVDQDRFIRLSYGTSAGLESQLVETDEYAFILRVISVVEPAPKPYERVVADVRTLADQQTRGAATLATAEGLLDDIGPSTKIPDLAENNDSIDFAKLGPVTRFGDSLIIGSIIPARLISPALMEKLFQANTGDVVQARVAGGHIVAKLSEILPPDAAELQQIREQVADAVSSSLTNDLIAGFTQSVTREFNVVLNREAIDELIPQ